MCIECGMDGVMSCQHTCAGVVADTLSACHVGQEPEALNN